MGKHARSPSSLSCDDCSMGVADTNGTIRCGPCSPGTQPSSDRTRCDPCPAGFYSNDGFFCYECYSGTYAAEESSKCTACPAGKLSVNNYTACENCSVGSSSWDGTMCYPCWQGSYSVGGTECLLCPEGRFSSADGASECALCSAGTYSAEGSWSCEPCGWSEVASEGSGRCDSCPGGSIPLDNRTACSLCPAGKYTEPGSAWCYDCWFGYSSEGSSRCEDCPGGTKPASDRASCEACPAGTTAEFGSEYCDSCGYGQSRSDNESACTSCEAGRYNDQFQSATCAECPGGRYSERSGSRQCTACPIGRYVNETGSNSSTVCARCLGGQTKNESEVSVDACLQPGMNQSVECSAGKTCSFVFEQGPGLLDTSVHAVMVKDGGCDELSDGYSWTPQYSYAGYQGFFGPDGFGPGGYGGPGGYDFGGSGGFYGGYGPGNGFPPFRRLADDAVTAVAGFGSSTAWITTNYSVSWPDPISATPGMYKLCWCGGFGFRSKSVPQVRRCTQPVFFDFEVGTMTVAGPFPNQYFTCVRGRFCLGGSLRLRGLGLTGDDLLTLRAECNLDGARRFQGLPFFVTPVASDTPGEVDLEFGLNYTVYDSPGLFNLCWCSSKGTPCTTMDLVSFSTEVYLETDAATLSLEGPYPGAEAECFLGQYCSLVLVGGGQNLLDDDHLTVLSRCGDSSFLSGFPTPGYTSSLAAGMVFYFASGPLQTEPGIYQLCWCRPDPAAGISCTTVGGCVSTL